MSRAEVIGMYAGLIVVGERLDMTVGEIHYVNVVTHAGAVGGVVVIAENAERHFAVCSPHDKRHEVVRNAVRIFTD